MPDVLEYITSISKDTESPFEMLSQAPWYVRLLSGGNYCAYKKSIYVPDFHLSLVSSSHIEDRTLATSKLLPVAMLLHDYQYVSLYRMLMFLYNVNYQMHYFLYGFLFLKATESQFFELVTMGFMASRKFLFRKIPIEVIELRLRNILENNAPTL